jgi:hypothetical protein
MNLNFKKLVTDAEGRIAVPILLYFLGVPGLLVIAIWFFVFRG